MTTANTRISRLEKLLFRMEAQVACLAWAFQDISSRPGMVFEMGLGHGRTFSHLRQYLPDRARFKSEDPRGQEPDVNPFRYVGNQATNDVDPSGLADWLKSLRSDVSQLAYKVQLGLGFLGDQIEWKLQPRFPTPRIFNNPP